MTTITRRRICAVFAHPDDETFRSGGTLAILARLGVSVHLITATRGEAGSCGEPPLCAPDELPALRERELRCACTALGLAGLHILGYADGQLAGIEPAEMIAELRRIFDETRPQVVITFGPDGLSGHADHIAIGQYCAQAYARSEGIAALYTMAVPTSLARELGLSQVQPIPDGQISLRVDVSATWEAKRAAMDCHATQRAETPLLDAPPTRQRLFFEREYFVRAACRRLEGDFLPDLLRPYLL